MKSFVKALALAALSIPAAFAQDFPSPYKPGPDAAPRTDALKGKVEGPIKHADKIYPGISTEYWIYVPANFDRLTTAPALMVFQDGWQYLRENGTTRAQNVFDNLIAKQEIPPVVGVFVNPGHSEGEKSPDDGNWNTRHRSLEYDTLSGDYATLLIDEILPEVAAKYKFSADPEMHAICGASSGGIASFTAAWERNDYFRKVVSHIGSFTDLRGGYVYPDKVRGEAKAKPIRIAMQDGLQDNRRPQNEKRDWVVQNRLLFEALCDKGYDVQFTFGTDKHRLDHGGSVLPDQLRWLWRDAIKSPEPKKADEMLTLPYNASYRSPNGELAATFGSTLEGYTLSSKLEVRSKSGEAMFPDGAGLGGIEVLNAQWTKDSRYLVIVGINGGGHSPWHHRGFIYSADERKLADIDEEQTSYLLGSDIVPIQGDTVQLTVHDSKLSEAPSEGASARNFKASELWQKSH